MRGWGPVQVGELNERLRHKHITLVLTDAALDYAVEQSYDHLCVPLPQLSIPCLQVASHAGILSACRARVQISVPRIHLRPSRDGAGTARGRCGAGWRRRS